MGVMACGILEKGCFTLIWKKEFCYSFSRDDDSDSDEDPEKKKMQNQLSGKIVVWYSQNLQGAHKLENCLNFKLSVNDKWIFKKHIS